MTTLGDHNRPQTIFLTKIRSYDMIEMIAQVSENKVFGKQITKKNTWEKY